MKKLLIILFAASLAVGCKGKKGWAQKDKTKFVSDCVNGAKAGMDSTKAVSYCTCMQGKIEVKYPKYADAGNLDMNTMTEMAKDCLK